MKRTVSVLLVLLCCLFSGCGKQPTAGLAGLTDPRGSIPCSQCTYAPGFVETSFADYYPKPLSGGSGCLIQVKPKGTDTFVPLCGRPNCAHRDESCNAFCMEGGLGYCGNRLFALDHAESGEVFCNVVSMLPDGTDRRVEVGLPFPVDSTGSRSGRYLTLFHENKLLGSYRPDMQLPLEEQVERLFVVDLETKEITEPFADFFTPEIVLGPAMQPVGQVIYTDCSFRDPDGSAEEWWIAMDMDTGEVKKLYPVSTVAYTIENGVMYNVIMGRGVIEYHLDTGETVDRGMPVPDPESVRVDGELVYIITNAGQPGDYEGRDFTLHILNRDYEELDQIHLGKGTYPRYVDSEYFYFMDGTRALSCRLEKARIGTGSLALEEMK